ncbi:Ephrin-B2a [Branchiostoma belcheri]|nr:Ephrin-B2a [Branchiostoma belcheri]
MFPGDKRLSFLFIPRGEKRRIARKRRRSLSRVYATGTISVSGVITMQTVGIKQAFRLSGWGYSITVELDDKVDIVCPRVFNRSRQDPQYNTLYQGKMLLRCDKPFQDNRFTMLFQEFSPSPFGLEFKPGRDYYYISTSTSELGGLDNKVGGNCRNGMRLKITVNQQTNIIPPVENTSESSHYVVDLTPNSIPREVQDASSNSASGDVSCGGPTVVFITLWFCQSEEYGSVLSARTSCLLLDHIKVKLTLPPTRLEDSTHQILVEGGAARRPTGQPMSFCVRLMPTQGRD